MFNRPTNIPALAAARGISITQLAKQVRLSRSYLSKLAWGRECEEALAARIATALEVDVTTAFPALVGERAISERRSLTKQSNTNVKPQQTKGQRTARGVKKARNKARRVGAKHQPAHFMLE